MFVKTFIRQSKYHSWIDWGIKEVNSEDSLYKNLIDKPKAKKIVITYHDGSATKIVRTKKSA